VICPERPAIQLGPGNRSDGHTSPAGGLDQAPDPLVVLYALREDQGLDAAATGESFGDRVPSVDEVPTGTSHVPAGIGVTPCARSIP
jgi:hypothetical protein